MESSRELDEVGQERSNDAVDLEHENDSSLHAEINNSTEGMSGQDTNLISPDMSPLGSSDVFKPYEGDINDKALSCNIGPETRSCSSRSDANDNKSSDSSKRTKRKSWYNSFYPNYKSTSDDFKKIFTTLPVEERLIAGYSCALQKDILIHGRLYFTKNYLCFYSKILSWETQVELAWKDVTSITKEKTALVIPNAIQIWTDKEKFFFASFTTRDRTFCLLEKMWQLSMSDQTASASEIWKLVHSEYGEDLGLTSDDETDYASPVVEDGLNSPILLPAYKKSASCSKMLSEESLSPNVFSSDPSIPQNVYQDQQLDTNLLVNDSVASSSSNNATEVATTKLTRTNKKLSDSNIPTDLSDSTEEYESVKSVKESESRKKKKKLLPPPPAICPGRNLELWRMNHDGRELANEIFPLSVNQLFTLLFTSSKFFSDFHTLRKTFNIVQSSWSQKPNNEGKERNVSFTISFTHPIGLKTSQVSETQRMKADSCPGYYYMIDVDTVNAGIPHADSFYVTTHFCLSRVNDHESRLTIRANIKYKKNVWGLVKTFIERNTWTGIEEFYSSLIRALHVEAEKRPPGSKSRIPGVRNVPRLASLDNRVVVGETIDNEEEESNNKQEKLQQQRNAKVMKKSVSTFDLANIKKWKNSFSVAKSGRKISTSVTSLFKLIPNKEAEVLVSNKEGPFSSKEENLSFKEEYCINTGHSNIDQISSPSSSALSSSSGDVVVKLILFLLISLFLTNLLLFYKLWVFETNLTEERSSHSFGFDLRRVKPLPQSNEEWLQLLEEQQYAQQKETEKWFELLGNAMTVLRQTELSLGELQKAIYPLTLQKWPFFENKNEETPTSPSTSKEPKNPKLEL